MITLSKMRNIERIQLLKGGMNTLEMWMDYVDPLAQDNGVLPFYMKHCNYEKLKPKLIKAGMGHIRNESKEEIACAQDMFETIFRDYQQEKNAHISSLRAVGC